METFGMSVISHHVNSICTHYLALFKVGIALKRTSKCRATVWCKGSDSDPYSCQDSGVHEPDACVRVVCDVIISHAFILAVNQMALGLIV